MRDYIGLNLRRARLLAGRGIFPELDEPAEQPDDPADLFRSAAGRRPSDSPAELGFLGFPIHFEVWGVLILLVAAATDVMDGYIARKRSEITTLGILLDPDRGQTSDFRRVYFAGARWA